MLAGGTMNFGTVPPCHFYHPNWQERQHKLLKHLDKHQPKEPMNKEQIQIECSAIRLILEKQLAHAAISIMVLLQNTSLEEDKEKQDMLRIAKSEEKT